MWTKLESLHPHHTLPAHKPGLGRLEASGDGAHTSCSQLSLGGCCAQHLSGSKPSTGLWLVPRRQKPHHRLGVSWIPFFPGRDWRGVSLKLAAPGPSVCLS